MIDPGPHLYWLGSRAVGIVALLLITASVVLGLALSGRMAQRPGGAGRLKAYHEALALAALIAIAGHGALLTGDEYLHPGPAEVVLPFAIDHKPFWTGIGVIGGWLAAILGLSYYVRRWIGTKTWRWLHRWTLAVYVLGVAHTLGAGTDAGALWMRALVAATIIPVVFAGIYRFLPRKKMRNARPAGRTTAPGAQARPVNPPEPAARVAVASLPPRALR